MCLDSLRPAARPAWNSGQCTIDYLSSLRSKVILISLGMTAASVIFGILTMSVMKERLVPNIKAPCPATTDNLLLANLAKIF